MTASHREVRVNVFPGIQNLPHFAAIEQGYFAMRGIDVVMAFTTSSEVQREALAGATCDIAHAAVDNAVAMVDVAKEDVIIVIGLDPSFNRFVVQPEVKSYKLFVVLHKRWAQELLCVHISPTVGRVQ